MTVLVSAVCRAWSATGEERFDRSQRWRAWIDLGGAMPQNASLSKIGGPVTGGNEMELSPRIQMDSGAGYRFTPWSSAEGEFGLTYHQVDPVGNWIHRNSARAQLLMMVNGRFERPGGPFVPFVGIGAAGVYSSLTFGNNVFSDEPDGSGKDFVPAFQAFAGARYEFTENWSLELLYHCLHQRSGMGCRNMERQPVSGRRGLDPHSFRLPGTIREVLSAPP